ncbi:two-component system sensor histidine kinase NtrB [Geobacter argillaceus]|uniref:histidine kinase n=1 Tax=Geobacter argillaceus TaxID=345631 RepID=A0A562VFU6_9BACT|nr:ATP-binding protein [Geobacter argillaceus]TWJ16681.1 two-component system sensor histidine kinase HydH [Geobacter argillaceus]
MLKRVLLLSGIGLTLALLWFAVSNYRAATPLAEESLRGVALSISAAVENIAAHDPSLHSLTTLHPKDVAFLALLDKEGTYRFHSNPDLVGTRAEDDRYRETLTKGTAVEGRVLLGTGEKAYEFLAPLHLADTTLILRLILHTYRADAVIRRSELNMTIILALLLAGWVMAAMIYRFAMREEMHTLEMAKQESLARLGEMGATLAHEIRNPLGGIKGFAQIIGKKPMDTRNSDFAGLIVGEVLRLEHLVASLLAYARSDLPAATLFSLDELISHSVSLMRPELERLGIAVVVSCPERFQCHGDRDRLGQVLLNLIQNAIQAMPDGGTLSIAAGARGKGVSVSVADTGHGISNEDKERMFEPFYTTRAKGTGLGLALCKKIIEEHNGTIDVTSSPGKGTTVAVELPGGIRK